MARFDENTLAMMEYAVIWSDGENEFEDRYIGRRVNAWRDIFPAGIEDGLKGLEEGQSASAEFAPGELVPPWRDDNVLTLARSAFRERVVAGRRIVPRVGRFYPQGMLSGLRGVYASTQTPFRVLELTSDTITVDMNHPLSRFPVRVEARLDHLENKRSDTGGTLMHWPEEISDNGPGMQAVMAEGTVDFRSEDFFERVDGDDASFYAQPRLIGHVDAQAQANLRRIYARFLKPGMKVLDLMSSVQSHLPEDMELDVTGLGLNHEEMAGNPQLSSHIVHDLNACPDIPHDGPFDAVVCSLSIEYLTDPMAVLTSARKLLRPGGVLLVGVSNRWFPTKAVQGWLDLHEFERVGFVRQLQRWAGFSGRSGAISIRNDWRPQDDRHFLETRGISDPVFVIWTHRDDEK